MTAPLNHPLPLLDLDVLRTFVAIAETGSFTAAAKAVFRTPSAVSMQIKKLEDILGRSVFARDARSVTLTTDGEMLLGYARRLLAINREAVSKFIVPDIVGVVRLGSPDDYGERVLPHVLKRFAQSHPSIAVDVTIDQSVNLRRRMDDRALDITLLTNSYKTSAIGADAIWGEQWLILEHLTEEPLGRIEIPVGGEQEVDRLPMLVDGPVEVAPLAADPDVSLVDPDRSAVWPTELAQPLLDQRCVSQNPTVQGGVVHLQTSFQEHLLDVAVAQRVAQVPGDRLDDQRRLEVAAPEISFGALLKLGGDGGQDHGPAPKRSSTLSGYG